MKINLGYSSCLQLLFIGFKLSHIIDWDWLFVLMPTWIPLAIFLVCCILYCVFKLVSYFLESEGR